MTIINKTLLAIIALIFLSSSAFAETFDFQNYNRNYNTSNTSGCANCAYTANQKNPENYVTPVGIYKPKIINRNGYSYICSYYAVPNLTRNETDNYGQIPPHSFAVFRKCQKRFWHPPCQFSECQSTACVSNCDTKEARRVPHRING